MEANEKGKSVMGKIATAAFWAAIGATSVVLTDKRQRNKVTKEIGRRKDEATDLVKNVTDKAKDLTKRTEEKLRVKKEELEKDVDSAAKKTKQS